MALDTLKDVKEINNEKIVDMNALQETNPEMFRPDGSMIYHLFEEKIRPHNFIYVRHDVNSLSFTLQNGPIKEVGKNGCQVEDIIAVSKHILFELNQKFPCLENSMALTKLDECLFWMRERTRNRIARDVEGKSQA